MALTQSTMLPLGTQAPNFELPDTNGNIVRITDFVDKKGLLVVFMCNHCPYVKHVRPELARIGIEYQAKGIGMVGINSNDAMEYPQDNPANMKREVEEAGYTFPYLYDATQEVAKEYRAACTPDFFLFDRDLKLVYRGQFDDTRPNSGQAPTGASLREALDTMLEGGPILEDQKPSMGCNIKWKKGNEPGY